jgi:hypothetical protein
MGNTWVVLAWGRSESTGIYEDVEVYRGQSGVAAVWSAIKAKRAGYGCVKVEWR